MVITAELISDNVMSSNFLNTLYTYYYMVLELMGSGNGSFRSYSRSDPGSVRSYSLRSFRPNFRGASFRPNFRWVVTAYFCYIRVFLGTTILLARFDFMVF